MACEEFAADIADLLMESASPEAKSRAEGHLAECATCRRSLELWNRMGEMPMEEPPAGLAAGFRRRLAVPQVMAPRRSVAPWLAAAAAIAAAIFGYFGGRATAPQAPSADLATLRQEVRGLREMMAITLLDQQSASERLRGVRYSTAMERPEPEIVDALARTLRSDPSVDVRLAAADALRKFPLPEAVYGEAWNLLDKDDSPLVQIAVVDLLAGRRAPGTRARLEALAGRPGLDPNVRDYLQALLSNQRNPGNPYQ